MQIHAAGLVLVALAAPVGAGPEDFVPPPDVGYVNVREAGARGDGKADDTAALKAVLGAGKGHEHKKYGAARAIYFPNGTYLVSEPLLIGDKKKALVGQSRDGVVIRLKDNCPGFGNPRKPAAVLDTTRYKCWHFAQNFFQRAHNLTIDVGAGNPGAVGLEYHTNNGGTLHNVRIRAGGPGRSGAVGLALTRGAGPGLVRDVTVEGFDVGCLITGTLHSMAFSRVTLAGQRVVGFENRGNTVSIEGLVSKNAVPAVKHSGGHLAMINARFTGGAPKAAAVVIEKGPAFIRHLKVAGYGAAVRNGAESVPGPEVDQYVWPKAYSLFGSPGKSLGLPVEQPPLLPYGDSAKWAVVRGGTEKDIQKAIDSGAETVFPAGSFTIKDTVHVRGKVRRVMGAPTYYRSVGFEADKLESYKPLKVKRPMKKRPVWRIEDGDVAVVVLELIGDNYGSSDWAVEHATKRTLVLLAAPGAYKNTVTGGKVFFVDSGPHPGSVIRGPQQAWAWHTNVESYAHDPYILNDGATLWVLGVKTEKDRTVIATTNGGSTELIGGLLFKNRERIGPAPAFTVSGGSVSLSYNVTRLPYRTHVAETRGGETRELLHKNVGWAVPLFTGYKAAGPKK